MNDETRKSLKVLPTTGAAGKLAELRAQPPATEAAPVKKLNDQTPIDRALDSALTPEQRRIKEKIIEALQQVYDPELPVNLYDLGLIYRLNLRDAESGGEATRGDGSGAEGREADVEGAAPSAGGAEGQIVEIDMTLTAPNCPVAEQIPRQVQEAAAAVEGVARVNVRLVWEPKWDKSRMSEAALLELGLL